MKNEKRCQKCKGTKDLFVNSKNKLKSGEISFSYMCTKCNTDRFRKLRKRKSYQENLYKAVYKSIEKYKEKQNSRLKLNEAIKKGFITRPEKCYNCEKIGKVEGHHDDYSKPYDVVWLCKRCHNTLHRKQNLLQ